MVREPKTNRRRRFPGISKDAAALGVRRTSLYLALSDARPGKSLFRRYLKLKAIQQAEKTATTTKIKSKHTLNATELLTQNRQLLGQLNQAMRTAGELKAALSPDAPAGALPDMPEITELSKAIEVVTARISALEAGAVPLHHEN